MTTPELRRRAHTRTIRVCYAQFKAGTAVIGLHKGLMDNEEPTAESGIALSF